MLKKGPSRTNSGAESILAALKSKPLSALELAKATGRASISGALKRLLKTLLGSALVELTIPGKPKSRLQKYRLTLKGRTFLAKKESSPVTLE